MTRPYDAIVVGAGFAGSVLAERLANAAGLRVLVVERRPHIGGNAYDYYDEHGILCHKYGPHIFHTNSELVYQYLSSFTPWRPYEHRVLSMVGGRLYPIPINLDTINAVFELDLSEDDASNFLASLAEFVPSIRTSEDVVVSKVGRKLFDMFFAGYTAKQWGVHPRELDSTVAGRIPVRTNRDDRYFSDDFQVMPAFGYTRMFSRMLDHANIQVELGTDFLSVRHLPHDIVFYSGAVDELFSFAHGPLPYRSLRFEFETLPIPFAQPVATINYPNEHLYTRSTEFKHLTGQVTRDTTVCREFPTSEGDPYYPIPRPENAELYSRYAGMAESLRDTHLVGRLGTYRYYNMDQVVAQALTLFQRITGLPPLTGLRTDFEAPRSQLPVGASPGPIAPAFP